jgi:hypothetical protein
MSSIAAATVICGSPSASGTPIPSTRAIASNGDLVRVAVAAEAPAAGPEAHGLDDGRRQTA